MPVIGSDFHGNISKCIRFLEYKPDELHIFAGDAVDSYTESPEKQEECLKLLLDSTSILLYGNHELSYTTHRISCSGKHRYGVEHFPKYVNLPRWQIAAEADGYVITHAGIVDLYTGKYRSPQALVKHLNRFFKENRSSALLNVGYARGGWARSGGPFWYDFRHDVDPLSKRFNQVFGHCALRDPWEDKTEEYHHVCVNSIDTEDRMWVFDTTKREIVFL